MLLALGRLTPEVVIIASHYPRLEPGRIANIVAD
jgi:hypothetical protein